MVLTKENKTKLCWPFWIYHLLSEQPIWPYSYCKSKKDQNIFLNYSFIEIQPLTFLTLIFWQIAGVKALCLITISYILHCQSKKQNS